MSAASSDDKLGTVSFSTSCAPAVQAGINRGVALLHDFWYEEAQHQFDQVAKADPSCAIAHWGSAMSSFHQIWSRPNETARAHGWAEIQQAQALTATPREKAYIDALAEFFRPGPAEFPARVQAYSDAMGKLYAAYPDDIDAGAFYALSLLAATPNSDTSLANNRKAMAVLTPLFAKYPDNPGLDHYIIHSCDNPEMAALALHASDHYGPIAASGAHAYHMPGHIYARLGMWPQDIAANLGSVTASQAAQPKYGSGLMDEPHAYDFLLYAYLQSAQDDRAQWVLDQTAKVLDQMQSMPKMTGDRMRGMVPYYRSKYAVFYALERRDWKAADVATLAVWARAIGHGHLHQADAARADLARYNALLDEIRKGKNAYTLENTGSKIELDEVQAWVAFAGNKQAEALNHMRAAADLQDKVGQGEVDIPAREMLGDMLLESHQPKEALAEYETALKLSPNRFNGLYQFYAALLKSTDNGAHSARPELAHAKSFLASTQVSEK